MTFHFESKILNAQWGRPPIKYSLYLLHSKCIINLNDLTLESAQAHTAVHLRFVIRTSSYYEQAQWIVGGNRLIINRLLKSSTMAVIMAAMENGEWRCYATRIIRMPHSMKNRQAKRLGIEFRVLELLRFEATSIPSEFGRSSSSPIKLKQIAN